MNEYLLLDLATDLGFELAVAGAETYRVEDSVRHVLLAYGLEPEVAAIPGYVIVSVLSDTGVPITRMRRIGFHGNNLDAVERLNALSRRLCTEKPEPEKAIELLQKVKQAVPKYGSLPRLLGHFLGAGGFGLLFGCSYWDALFAGLCGIAVYLMTDVTDRLKANPIFSTLAASFVMSFAAYALNAGGIVQNSDSVIIGGLMILVPGLLFTNALRDMIYGDINSGMNKCVQVLLIAVSMALGSAGARNLTLSLWGTPQAAAAISHGIGTLLFASLCGCIGFSILFNIHGPGILLCALGGILTFGIYDRLQLMGCHAAGAAFFATGFASLYAEIMARVRKYPTICYLVVSIIPLVPGAGLYYSMCLAVDGRMDAFVSQLTSTAGIAGGMAASVILISSLVRMYTDRKLKHI